MLYYHSCPCCVILPSLSPLAAVVSVESQLSCSSVVPTEATAEPEAGVLLLQAGVTVLPADSVGVSDSVVVFVHCRAFFYRKSTLQS